MHIHEVVFEVVNRQSLVLDEDGEAETPFQLDGTLGPREPWETGFKDTVIAYPGEVTRVRAQFKLARPVRLALPHRRDEDNEMTRPYRIGPPQPGQP